MTKDELKKIFDDVDQNMVDDQVRMHLAMELASKISLPDGSYRPTNELVPILVDTMMAYQKDYTFRVLASLIMKLKSI